MPSKIEWCQETWNPITGCSHTGSPGCDHCYAKRMAQRLKGRYGYPKDDPFKVTFHPDKLDQPLRWRKPRRIFVVSMGDLFHKDVKGDWMWRILDAAWDSPSYHRHTYIFLTKRPERMADEMDNWMRQHALSSLPKRWWLGITAENQQAADERIPILLQIPAAVRFVSCEPLLSEINLELALEDFQPLNPDFSRKTPPIQWVIVGGESSPGARPMHPDWVRSIRDQCQAADVNFFFKQWGEWRPDDFSTVSNTGLAPKYCSITDDGRVYDYCYQYGNIAEMMKVGKKKAGRILDGRTWDEFPKGK